MSWNVIENNNSSNSGWSLAVKLPLLGCCESYIKIFGGRLTVDQKQGSCTSTETRWANRSYSELIIKLRFSKPSLQTAASTALHQLNRRAGEILTWDLTLHEFISMWIPGVSWNISNILWLALECLSKLRLINLGCLSNARMQKKEKAHKQRSALIKMHKTTVQQIINWKSHQILWFIRGFHI